MKGLCTKIIKHHELTERPDVADYPTYEVIAELSYPIEEGLHMHLELNDKLTLLDVVANQLGNDVYSLTFDLQYQDEMRDTQATTEDLLAAMMYVQQGYLPVNHVVDTMRQRIRTVVPDNLRVEVTLEGETVRVRLADGEHLLSLRTVYTQHLLTGPIRYSWQEDDDTGLRMHYNMPPVEDMERWFAKHNQTLLDSIEDMKDVAACCLACVSSGKSGLEYAYIVVLMNGSCTTTKMNVGQVLCMINSGKCPEVVAQYVEDRGLDLTVYNDELLPQALPMLEQLTDAQLALTADL